MFSDPQFWVAVSFILFIAAIFNPVRKMLVSSLDAQISEIKTKIDKSLIGGIKIKHENKIFDNSIQYQLNQLKKTLHNL